MRRRIRARRLTREFNASHEDGVRAALLADLLGSVGTDVLVEPPFYCDYGSQIRVGDHALPGPSVQVYTAEHPVDPGERRRSPESALPVTIRENVWVGGGAILCPGGTIGAGMTVGAGSVVVRDLPAGVLAVGNPCRVVRIVSTR